MKYQKINILILSVLFIFASCKQKGEDEQTQEAASDTFQYKSEQFADLKILRYKIPGWEKLPLKKKKLAYYLQRAGLSGRDIIWDQNYKYNLLIRRTLESVYQNYTGNKEGENWDKFLVYLKRIWFSNGIHHHYSTLKIQPDFPEEYFQELVMNTPPEKLPWSNKKSPEELYAFLKPKLFDPKVAAKKVNKNPGVDMVKNSATNYYEGVTQKEVEEFYQEQIDTTDKTPVSYGLNSKVVREDGEISEKKWKVGGMYSEAITRIVDWLEKAVKVAENEQQKKTLQLLIDYYQTGDLEKFVEYNIAWVNDTASRIDAINGFIEVYADPLGTKGSFESVTSMKDLKATERIKTISDNAQWFEDHSTILDKHKKEEVKGISAKVITVVGESGDASPSTPIGINLPNSSWIREQHGSKSVSLGNIIYAYDEASKNNGLLEEFAHDKEEIKRSRKHGALAGILHTDLHEVIGHASGKQEEKVPNPKDSLKSYYSTLEEARADLVAMYFILDKKLVDLGLMPGLDVGKAAYDGYIRNGLMTQLKRLNPGEDLEEAHMRNRQLISKWVFEKGKADQVIEKVSKDGKTYYNINDYQRLRKLFGQLLKEIQRIKSRGDYQAGKELVENYGIKVDDELHKEVLERYEKLNIAPYGGFINPKMEPVKENGEIVDIKVTYPKDFSRQMLYYSKNFSFLPVIN